MSKTKGPHVELPEEFLAELENAMAGAPDAAASDRSESESVPEDSPESEPAPESCAEPALDLALQLEQVNDRHLRLAAEFDNYKRRMLRERQDLLQYGNENLVKQLLPTVDNLERALEHARCAKGGKKTDKLLEGVELTYRSLMQLLERFGVAPIEAEGKPFDPAVHEAIRQVSSSDHEPGTVIEVLQCGYILQDRLLRPALVVVAAADSEGES